MKIAFATPLAATASTILGRTIPVAKELAAVGHDVHVLVLSGATQPTISDLTFHTIGNEPFIRTAAGKQRLSGLRLVSNMLGSAWRMAWHLRKLQPDVVILVKTLPTSVTGVWLWRLLGGRGRIILDMDDFELAANHLSSILQRAFVHLAERRAIALADSIVVATPFLLDHAKQLAKPDQKVTLIPTGLSTVDATDVTGDRLQLVYLGSISLKSGHRVTLLPDILAKVRKHYPGLLLIMAGDGDDVQMLKNAFAKLNLETAVRWVGRFDANHITSLLSTKTIIIDPVDSSIEARAKSSYRVAVATSLGLAVVTSNIGIRPTLLPESLHDRLFALPDDSQDYAKKIVNLCDTPLTDLEQLSLRNHSEQFTWEKLARQYISL